MITSLIISFVYGVIFGSFLNVVILRLPLGKSLTGRSSCPHCGYKLGVLDLLPLISYAALRGRCRSCGKRISPRYFIIECTVGLLFALAFYLINPTLPYEYVILLKYWFVLAVLVAVFVIDFEHFLILNKVVYPATMVVLACNVLLDIWTHVPVWSTQSFSLSGIVAGAVSFLLFFSLWYFSKGRWIGFGDVKYMLFLGVVLGWPLVWVGLFLSFVGGGLVGVGLLATGSKTMKSKLPLGTFLSVGTLVALLWGNQVLHWYISLVLPV